MSMALAGRETLPAHRPALAGWLDIVVVGVLAAAAIIAFGQWLDNAQLMTSNGLWKSTAVTAWKNDWRSAPLDASNYLYYPLVAGLCRLLDLLGVHVGQAWRQMVVVDGAFAGLAVGALYWMVRSLTGRRDVAAFAAFFQTGCAFFLGLAMCNEDILPSFTMLFVSTTMAAVWFNEPSTRQVACVSLFFTLGWLIEWRLMFPTLPPLLLALALSQGTLMRRGAMIVLFLVVMVGAAWISALCWHDHLGGSDLQGVLWTGKGVDTGWAGFSLDKLAMVALGMGEYWLGGHNMAAAHLMTSEGAEWGLAFALEIVVLGFGLLFFWRRRHNPMARTVAIVFLGTLGAGEFFNAYSQPADPQMQINVMPWFVVVVALLVADLAGRYGRFVVLAATALAIVPLAYNARVFSATRGVDSQQMGNLAALEAISDPAATVYIFTGFEGITTWMFITWDPHWEGVCEVGPSPMPSRKFK
ncbi:MAG: hypothetical protein JOY81_09135, partial [Alphaproteobacteria bacterium]|nr:hypothetical protein [Alphaproteobacteria bacterium]